MKIHRIRPEVLNDLCLPLIMSIRKGHESAHNVVAYASPTVQFTIECTVRSRLQQEGDGPCASLSSILLAFRLNTLSLGYCRGERCVSIFSFYQSSKPS